MRRATLSAFGGSNSHGNHANKHRSRTEHMDPTARRKVTRTLNTSFMAMDANGVVMPKTPQAAIMAAPTYLASHPPLANDPKMAMHKSALAGLGLIGAALHDEAPAELKRKVVVRFNRSPTPSSDEDEHDLPRRRKSPRRCGSDYDARNDLA